MKDLYPGPFTDLALAAAARMINLMKMSTAKKWMRSFPVKKDKKVEFQTLSQLSKSRFLSMSRDVII